MKRLILIVVVALVAVIYFRPLAVFDAVRHAWLFAHGFRGHTVMVGRWHIHYLEGGDGPPVVAVHGLASRGADWAPLLPDLARSHRVYAIDLLGYGESDKPQDADYSIAAEADVVRGFLDAKQISQADVVAVSMGGWIALKLAAGHPERVRRLVLFDSAGLAFPTTLTVDSFAPRDIRELRQLIALQTDRGGLMPDFVARDFLRVNREHAWILRRQMESMLSRRDLMDGKLGTVTVPVLLLWGTADQLTPIGTGRRMQRELPHARLIELGGCGHLAIVDCRAEAYPAVISFLR